MILGGKRVADIVARSKAVQIIAAGPPVNLSAPNISGTFEQFQTLTCNVGSWGGAPTIVYTFQWMREDNDLVGETAQTYVATYLDVGFRLRCRVTGTNGSGFATVTSGYTLPIDLVNVALPTIPSMIFAFEPGDASSNYTTLDQTFAASDFDVAGNKLATAEDLHFPEFVQTSDDYKGTPVFISSTGTLPGGLEADTPYYLSAVPGGYAFYPEQRTNDYLNMPTAHPFETLMRAQNYVERTNRVTITSQGTGVHRLRTTPLIDTIYDRLGTGCTTQNRTLADRHSALQVEIDGNGRHVVSRELARAAKTNEGGSYNLYGPSPVQGGISKGAARAYSADRRAVWATHVARLKLPQNRSVRKNNFAPSMVNTTTGVFTYTNINGRFATGNMVKFRTGGAGNAIPTGFTAGTEYYVYFITATTFTVHANSTDAATGANPIIPTDAGTGKFVIYAPRRVGDFHRQIFFQEWLEPNGGANTLSPYVKNSGPSQSGLLSSSAWTVSGANNGDVLGIKNFGDLRRVLLWFSPEAVRPIATDTGLALADGNYYVTKYTGGNDYGRLHRTLADAQACVGVATASCLESQCIKFDGTAVDGESLINWDDTVVPWVPNAVWDSGGTWPADPNLADAPFDYQYMLPNDDNVHTFTFLIDNNNPDKALGIYKLYIDGVLQHEWEMPDSTKGNSDPTWQTGQPAWTWLNSAALHVPFCGDIYATYMGASTSAEVTDAEILELHEYTFAKFAVTQGEPVPLAPTNTVLPAITGTLTTGQTLTCSAGTWAEYPAGTKTYQWKRGGVNISGATASTYLLIAEDADQNISCSVTSTNASGAATANAASVGPIVGVPAAPTAAVAGTISGGVDEGFVLTLTPTVWSGYPAPSVTRQWKRNGSDISGATGTTYTTTSSDAGQTITCTETATNASGTGNSTSNGIGPIVAAPSFEAEATTLFGRMSPAPDASMKLHANTLIKALKDAGVWSKLDMLQVYAAPDAQHALLDWKVSTRTASVVTSGGAPNFTADRGYVGTVFSGGGYIDTGYNSVTFAGNFTQNSAHKGVFVVEQGSDATGGNGAAFGVTRAYTIPRTNGSNARTSALNNTANNYVESGLANARHHFSESRSASGAMSVYMDGSVLNASHTSTSVTPTNANWKALGREGSTSVTCHRVAIIHAGGALSDAEMAAAYAAFHAYLTSRGVPNLPPFSPPGLSAGALAVGTDGLVVGSEELTVS